MTKIIFGINVPYQSTEIDWELTKGEQEKFPDRLFFMNHVRVPCIRHMDLYFELCDICGSQIPTGRVSRGIKTCSPACNKKKNIRWAITTENQERLLVGKRPTFFWNVIRKECFERDNYKCQDCGKDIRDNIRFPGEAHHIVPISEGGTNELSNLKTLCYSCHKKAHSRVTKIKKQHKCLEVG